VPAAPYPFLTSRLSVCRCPISSLPLHRSLPVSPPRRAPLIPTAPRICPFLHFLTPVFSFSCFSRASRGRRPAQRGARACARFPRPSQPPRRAFVTAHAGLTPLFSCPCALFRATGFCNPLIFISLRTLCVRLRGVGYPRIISFRSPSLFLLLRNSPPRHLTSFLSRSRLAPPKRPLVLLSSPARSAGGVS
jgi:hypothetical protein